MDKLATFVEKAKHSKFYLWLLNVALLRMVPFNNPHKIKIQSIVDGEVTMIAGNIKNNQNHIQGVHACLLATLCEYVSGFSLLLHLSPKEYRIILKNIHMTYHYQAKTAVLVKFKLTEEQVKESVLIPLQNQESLFREYEVNVYDTNNNHICTGLINWQIKAWKHVKLKVS